MDIPVFVLCLLSIIYIEKKLVNLGKETYNRMLTKDKNYKIRKFPENVFIRADKLSGSSSGGALQSGGSGALEQNKLGVFRYTYMLDAQVACIYMGHGPTSPICSNLLI